MGLQGRILAAYGSLPVQIPTDQTVEVDQLFMLITLLSGQLEENIIIFIRLDVCLLVLKTIKFQVVCQRLKCLLKVRAKSSYIVASKRTVLFHLELQTQTNIQEHKRGRFHCSRGLPSNS